MGLGMAAVNAGVRSSRAVDQLESETGALMNVLQINWLQPIYTPFPTA